jgi:hypothetical protein
VLLPRPLDPHHVVEQQRLAVAGGQAAQLEVGPVQDDPAQRADLGIDSQPARWRVAAPLSFVFECSFMVSAKTG